MNPEVEKYLTLAYSKGVLRAMIVWLRFEIDCEEFDRSLPGALAELDRGSTWVPRGDVMGESRRYARKRAELRDIEGDQIFHSAELTLTKAGWEEAKVSIQRMTFEDQKETLHKPTRSRDETAQKA